jgi:1,2-diacylglycerol 3-alpha-glucosyltransferase
MRIGIFTDTYPPYVNGVSTSIVMLTSGLRALGHEVYIVTVNPDSKELIIEDYLIRIPGFEIGIYDYRLAKLYPLKAVKTIKSWNLDIIHSQTEFSLGTLARIISKQYGIPLVHTYHTMYDDYVSYVTKGYFDKVSHRLLDYLTMFYCDKTINRLIVPTEKAKRLFLKRYGTEKQIDVIPTGIELSRFYPENLDPKQIDKLRSEVNIKKEDFTVLFVGRIGEEKNIEFLIKNKVKGTKLLIVGDGPLMPRLEKESDDDVIFTGKVKWEDIPVYYNISTVFATASTSETQGLTVLEALASSRPVVCINDDAFIKTVTDKFNGRIFSNGEEYQTIIKELKEKGLDHLTKNTRDSVQIYSKDIFAKSALKTYNSVIKEYDSNFLRRIKNLIVEG